MKKLALFTVALFAMVFVLNTAAQEFNYVGVKKCGMCHRSEKSGNQLKVWQNSLHSKAYETLKTDEADAIAKKAGYDTPAVETDACLKCHTAGHGLPADRFEKSFDVADGVQCETCHGPGSGYKSMKVMKNQAEAVEMGLQIWKSDEEIAKFCQGCHNEESPTFKGFDFAKMYPKIKHNIPSE